MCEKFTVAEDDDEADRDDEGDSIAITTTTTTVAAIAKWSIAIGRDAHFFFASNIANFKCQ